MRFVLHFAMPASVEAYYQEVGRAGRDGAPARCELLFDREDIQLQEYFITVPCVVSCRAVVVMRVR